MDKIEQIEKLRITSPCSVKYQEAENKCNKDYATSNYAYCSFG
jgi:hypothetical protein